MEFNYMRAEFNRVITDDVDAQNYRLKLSSGVGDTRWLNVSAESAVAIRDLLVAAEDAEKGRSDHAFVGAHFVTRDGAKVSPYFRDENLAHAWLQRHQGMSNDWAVKHEGYRFRVVESVWPCVVCKTDQPDGATGVQTFIQNGPGEFEPVKNADGTKALRCMECENKIQHPA